MLQYLWCISRNVSYHTKGTWLERTCIISIDNWTLSSLNLLFNNLEHAPVIRLPPNQVRCIPYRLLSNNCAGMQLNRVFITSQLVSDLS